MNYYLDFEELAIINFTAQSPNPKCEFNNQIKDNEDDLSVKAENINFIDSSSQSESENCEEIYVDDYLESLPVLPEFEQQIKNLSNTECQSSIGSIIKVEEFVSSLTKHDLSQADSQIQYLISERVFYVRPILEDINSLYRALIFLLLENIIIKKNIDQLNDLIVKIILAEKGSIISEHFESCFTKELISSIKSVISHIEFKKVLYSLKIIRECLISGNYAKSYKTLLLLFNNLKEFESSLIILIKLLIFKVCKSLILSWNEFALKLKAWININDDKPSTLLECFFNKLFSNTGLDNFVVVADVGCETLNMNLGILLYEQSQGKISKIYGFNPCDSKERNFSLILVNNQSYYIAYNREYVTSGHLLWNTIKIEERNRDLDRAKKSAQKINNDDSCEVKMEYQGLEKPRLTLCQCKKPSVIKIACDCQYICKDCLVPLLNIFCNLLCKRENELNYYIDIPCPKCQFGYSEMRSFLSLLIAAYEVHKDNEYNLIRKLINTRLIRGCSICRSKSAQMKMMVSDCDHLLPFIHYVCEACYKKENDQVCCCSHCNENHMFSSRIEEEATKHCIIY